MPYAYGATIQHVFDTDHLDIYITFRHPMQRSAIPQATPPVYDWYPPLAKWLLEADEVDVDLLSSEWLDEHTLLLTSDNVAAEPTGVTLEYNGPDEHLTTTWGKQWEPWGPIPSYAGYPTAPALHNSTHENGGSDEIDLTGLTYRNLWPQRATMWHDESTVTNGNPLFAAYMQYENHAFTAYQEEPADGDAFTSSFVLKAGTYNFYVLGVTDSDQGKTDWYIDNVLIVTGQDWYSPTQVFNSVKTVADVVITGDGYHLLKCVMNGKNQESSDYYNQKSKFWLKPTADPSRV